MTQAFSGTLAGLFLLCALVASSAVDTVEIESVPLPFEHTFRPAPPGNRLSLHLERIATGLEQPLYLTAPAEGSKLFAIERTGCIRVIENGDVRAEPFLDLRGQIDWAGERGLLGLAFGKDYEKTGRFYVAYSEKESCATVIARYQADVATSAGRISSGEEILRVVQTPGRIDHKSGWIGFRPGEPDNLYVATGDGGDHNDPDNLSQNLHDRRGKILRVDVSGSGPGFAVPKDNPFVHRKDALPEIWAYGLRNPFRASFDRQTGDLYFGDVGQDAHEEIDFEPASAVGGRNYGWRIFEGRQRNRLDPEANTEGLTPPILDYAHEDMMFTRGCVIGGYVYRGSDIPGLKGAYFFGDFTNACIYSLRYLSGKVEELTNWTAQLNAHDSTLNYGGLVSFGEDARGELYVVDFSGSIFKIVR